MTYKNKIKELHQKLQDIDKWYLETCVADIQELYFVWQKYSINLPDRWLEYGCNPGIIALGNGKDPPKGQSLILPIYY